MAIAEGSGVRLSYKFYSSGSMVADTEADTSTAPGATGGQVLRYTQSSLNLKTNMTKSAEILPSRQVRSNRRTSRHVEGSIMGELSPVTYFDFVEAALRGTRVAATGPLTGASVIVPSSGHVRRLVAVERYNTDLDLSRLYTEMRVTGIKFTVPAQGISTIEIPFMGRNRKTFKTTAAPYFTTPTAATTGEVCNSLSGSFNIDGTRVGLVTAASINVAMTSEAPNVLGQEFCPDVLLGTTSVDGSLTFLLDDQDQAATLFEAETEFAVQLVLTNATTAGDSITIDLPRCKLNTADEDVRGDLSQPVTCAFTALEATTGGILSTIQITDSAVTVP
jgi:Phage tail tube protein